MNRRSPAWGASVLVAGSILPLLLMTWIPLNASEKISVHLYEKISATAQVTPISPDLTVTALENQKLSQEVTMTARENARLTQEIGQLQHANERTVGEWLWNNALTTISTSLLILAAFAGIWRWFLDRRKEQEKRSEDRFQSVVESLGGERTETKLGGAIMLRTFLEGSYKRFHRQVFDLAVAHLRLAKPGGSDTPTVSSQLDQALTAVLAAATLHKKHPAQMNHYETPGSLSQALITVFKISFPLARAQLEKRNREYKDQNYRELDATGIELDNAYLVGTDLNGVWMPEASLVKADLTHIHLSHTNLAKANLTEACLKVAELKHTNLRGAILTKADLTGADLAEADLTEAYLDGTNLTGADLSGSNPQAAKTLTGAIMRNVRGFTDPQQRQKCRDMHAIVEDIED